MATKKTTRKKSTSKKKNIPVIRYEVKLILLIAFFILYAFTLYFSGGGFVGRFFKGVTLGLFGFFGYLLPFFIFFMFLFLINKNFSKRKIQLLSGVLLFFIALLLVTDIFYYDSIKTVEVASFEGIKQAYVRGNELKSAGVMGDFLAKGIGLAIGKVGLILSTFVIIIVCSFLLTDYKITQLAHDLNHGFHVLGSTVKTQLQTAAKKRKIRREEQRIRKLEEEQRVLEEEDELFEEEPVKSRHIERYEFDDAFIEEEAAHPPIQEAKIAQIESTEPDKEKVTEEIIDNLEKTSKPDVSEYRKPSINLLMQRNRSPKSVDKDKIRQTAQKLEDILDNFGINIQVVGVTTGPNVNCYEVALEPGTKLSKVTNLADDIALNLAVTQVRIAPVPNKAAIGIEVPNIEKSLVGLREILSTKEFSQNQSSLKFAVGKDISGKPIVADLKDMPHLLIAGATGSGKSVCINTIVASILFNASPDEVKLLMIDPKVVELNVYNGIPHLILPVVTDPKKAAIALGWAVNEMENRYKLFADSKSKDIESYNKKHADDKLSKIVIIIDELSDLMMVASHQVEESIGRITQMARAAGIHLIVATQRPSVDVITGTIKANIPSRIAFSVTSYVDSKTILDRSGAEKLLGKGDMLLNLASSKHPKRVQGCFVSEKEIERLVQFIKNQDIETKYDEEVVQEESPLVSTNFEDELLEDAIKLVMEQNTASASMLQRRFRIGYNRAGRLIDMMEEMGIVGPPQGSKPRELLRNSYVENETEEENEDS